MNELQVFQNPDFGSIRTLTIDEEPWFVGKDVATALGYAQPSKAVIDHVDIEDKTFRMMSTSDFQNGNLVKTAIINESGLYCLVLSSKLPSAKKFKRWVTSEVLPAIRKTGMYALPQSIQRDLTTDDYLKAALIVSRCKNERLHYVLDFLGQAGFHISEVKSPLKLCKNVVKDSIISFLDHCEGIENKATNLIYSQYQKYCIENDLDALSHGEFSKQIKQCLGFSIIDKRINNKKYRIFIKN